MSEQTSPTPSSQARHSGQETLERLGKRNQRSAEPVETKPAVAQRIRQVVLGIDTLSIVFAILIALLLGATIVAFSNAEVTSSLSYFFAQPGDFFSAFGGVFAAFFNSLFVGAIFDPQGGSLAGQLRPITETMTLAVPLILAGLSVSVAFKAGLFNVGGQGQIVMGAICAGYIGFTFHLPIGLHLLLAIFGAVFAGAIWGGIPGFLKAKLGANEVVVTIMMNSIATYFLARKLQTKAFIGNGQIGKSQAVHDSAVYPNLLGGQFRLHAGFIVAILAAILLWWILERSTFGFELRAAGANPEAARTAGVNVPRVIFLTMALAGALAGLAGTAPALGTSKVLTDGVAGSYGFDAITVALLGRSHPLGVILAGLLFGALAAGGSTMQAGANIPVDIVQVTQAIIVLLVAAAEFMKYYRAKKLVQRKAVKQTAAEQKTNSAKKEGGHE